MEQTGGKSLARRHRQAPNGNWSPDDSLLSRRIHFQGMAQQLEISPPKGYLHSGSEMIDLTNPDLRFVQEDNLGRACRRSQQMTNPIGKGNETERTWNSNSVIDSPSYSNPDEGHRKRASFPIQHKQRTAPGTSKYRSCLKEK
jgi:hypothetical protein